MLRVLLVSGLEIAPLRVEGPDGRLLETHIRSVTRYVNAHRSGWTSQEEFHEWALDLIGGALRNLSRDLAAGRVRCYDELEPSEGYGAAL